MKEMPKEKIQYKALMQKEWELALDNLKLNQNKTYEEIEDYADNEWVKVIAEELEVSDLPLPMIQNYIDFLSDKGIVDKIDYTAVKKGDKIIITMPEDYSPLLKRGKLFSHLLQIALKKTYNYSDKKSNNKYSITLEPGVYSLKVALSQRMGKGSIKVSENDIEKLGVDIIEDVTVVPVGKETGVVEMLSSDSKVSPGFVIMNIGDANLVGIREGDRVEIIKKSGGQDEFGSIEDNEIGNKTGQTDNSTDDNEPENEKQEIEDGESDTVEQEEDANSATKDTEKEFIKKPSEEIISKSIQSKRNKNELKGKKIKKEEVSSEFRTKKMKDFESKIDAIRNQ